jgi:uncharacterized protein YqeY
MSLMATIKADQLKARKLKDSEAASILTTLIGEASMPGKNDGNRESTDDEVQAVIKKFHKNCNETFGHLVKSGTHADSPEAPALLKLQMEIDILEKYMPKQMTDAELTTVICGIVDGLTVDGTEKSPRMMGEVMKELKANFDGSYDGKMASSLVKAALV